MNDPAEKNQPQQSRQTEMDQRHDGAALDKLAQARDEETTDGGDNVSRRTLTTHDAAKRRTFPRTGQGEMEVAFNQPAVAARGRSFSNFQDLVGLRLRMSRIEGSLRRG